MDNNNDIVKILEIFPSDILSESMKKINYNFNAIASKSDVTDYKLLALAQRINARLDSMEGNITGRYNDLSRGMDSMNNKLDNIDTSADIKNAIDQALADANLDVQNFIITHVEDTVNHKYGDYVTTSAYIRDKNSYDLRLGKLTNDLEDSNRTIVRISSAFDEWKSDAVTGTASASRIVANATFFKTKEGYLVELYPDENGDDVVTTYTSLENWYDSESSVRAEVDPENKGLDDDDVAHNLIQKAKTKFRTINTEMSRIKQWVSENAAGFDILASVKSKEKDITAAILGYANEHTGESGIGINADVLTLDANNKLRLKSNTFTIESRDFNVDENGNVSSNNMTANNININGITLRSQGGKTVIDSNGILYATGAEITGNIKTNSLSAESTKDVDVDGYTGSVIKRTYIDGTQFNISTEGTISNGSNTIDVTNNSLYIEIVDELDNPDTSIIPDAKLYGVPVLCMVYKGETYRMSPGSWMRSGSGGDGSNMRFMDRGDILHMKINELSSDMSNYHLSGSYNLHNVSTYYFFRPEDNGHISNRPSASGKTFIDWTGGKSNGSSDHLYQFTVLTWGGSDGTSPAGITRSQLKSTYGLISNTTGDVGSYVLESSFGSTGSSYCGTGGETKITAARCSEMAAFIGNSVYVTKELSEILFTDQNPYTTSSAFNSADKCGSVDIMQLMKDLLMSGNVNHGFKQNSWETQYSPTGSSYGSWSTVTLERDAEGKFPFDGTGTYAGTNKFSMSYSYWPMYQIVKTSKYTTYNENANRVLVEVHVKAERNYPSRTGNTSISRMTCTGQTVGEVEFNATDITMEFSFCVVLNLSSSLSADAIKERIEQFLSDYDFSAVKTNNDSNYYNYFKLVCNIAGDIVNDSGYATGNTITLRLVDNYS